MKYKKLLISALLTACGATSYAAAVNYNAGTSYSKGQEVNNAGSCYVCDIPGWCSSSAAWDYAQSGSRGHAKGVIVEQFIDFDYEITLLTVRHKDGTSFCDPIGHIQKDGDYRFSWQPHAMSDIALAKSQKIAKEITDALGGYGVFGVELFIKGDEVFFNEVSPRPHDTGMVTLISQNINEFELHLRAILGLPIPQIQTLQPSASAAILLEGESTDPSILGIDEALTDSSIDIRIFGKKEIHGKRRMGVILAKDQSTQQALDASKKALSKIYLA